MLDKQNKQMIHPVTGLPDHNPRQRRTCNPVMREATIYDGQKRLGIVKVDSGRFTAINVNGKCIGTFGNLKAAVSAFDEVNHG
jgi:hypothetical protein